MVGVVGVEGGVGEPLGVVLGDVQQQVGLVGVARPAAAGVGLLPGVLPHVLVQPRPPEEGLATHQAGEGLVTGVDAPHVDGQLGLDGKGLGGD